MLDAGLGLFRTYFYAIDFAVAVAAPLIAYALYRSGRIDRFMWGLFWLGFVIGLTWEVPMQILNQMGDALAVHRYTRPPPVHFFWIIVSHSSWDGGLFLLGVGLMRLIGREPVLMRFRPIELAVLIGWGQASELWVELTSVSGEAWFYIVRPWNPALFRFNGQEITLMPQLIWLAAPVVFYFIALKLRGRGGGKMGSP
jgi:hypothetical protein